MTATAASPVPRIACVIVSYNGAAWITQCLQSLRDSRDVFLQLIVVDNASTDQTASLVRACSDVELIATGSNLGFGRANNLGIARALQLGAEYVFILNQDAQVAPEALAKLCEQAADQPGLGILCPLQLDAQGQALDPTFLHYYLGPFAPALLNDALLARPLQARYGVDAMPAAAWLMPRRFLEQVGGFDPLFFMYCEDDDLCNRARHHGWGIALVPAAHFFHCRGFHGQLSRESRRGQFNRRRSRLRSSLIRQIKHPAGGFAKNCWQALVVQGLAGLSALLAHLDWIEALAVVAALLKVASELPRLASHRRQCQQGGALWLGPPVESR
ncbi:hypothetical protein DBR47_20375 [Paucibacter sp. KBW04]|uniref:glycosyltransferase family 2 protein n=1 Tax=Paucibacter sp. KBW04 TaxID=2153361 RepID=UPI000F58300F|nr:glycosyltransferase family 2 protein [Paucibacter sp. KBW04]RQO55610.1 hypothetical protein DBR47_20375 [Paucibacter sp. KBW04]